MNRREFWLVLAFAVLTFFFVNGPVWNDPFDIDVAIFTSYGFIPIAVAVALLRRRAWSWKDFLLGTFEVTLLKYAITVSIAATLWAITGEPAKRPQAPIPPRETRPAVELLSMDPAQTRSESGTLMKNGAPVPGALVFVKRGVEKYRFDLPEEPIVIENDGTRFSPKFQIVEIGRPVLFRSSDGKLHTAKAKDFNHPSLPGDSAKASVLTNSAGVLDIRCSVHAEEPSSRIILVFGSLYERTDAEGRFTISGIPPGEVELGSEIEGAELVRSTP
jgi:hypothetical protein